MPIHLYRADTRPPQDVQTAHGFHGWLSLDADTARKVVTRCNGNNVDNTIVIPGAPGRRLFRDFLMVQAKYSLNDLMTWIKNTRDMGETPQVSTDEAETCGGYADGKNHVYQLTFTLNMQVKGAGNPVPAATAEALVALVNPHLVFDGATLATSNIIGVARGSSGLVEVAFLTAIPIGMITGYKAPPLPYPAAFQPMPAAAAQPGGALAL